MKTNMLAWAPSLSSAYGDRELYTRAIANLQAAGVVLRWTPTAAQAIASGDVGSFDTLSLPDKCRDMRWMLEQPERYIISAIGGYNAYQLLGTDAWRALCRSGKTLIGHSDFTALANASYARTGTISWYGPNLRNLGDIDTGIVSCQNMLDAIRSRQATWKTQGIYKDSFTAPSTTISEWWTMRSGQAQGIGIGGNIGTFFLLQGTPYMPVFDRPMVLFVEEDEMPGVYALREFDRKLRSILDQPGARQYITGLIVGRFLDASQTSRSALQQIIDEIDFFADKPVFANVEIGHGMPRCMLPIGGKIAIDTTSQSIIVYTKE